jgi:hypothetical protein
MRLWRIAKRALGFAEHADFAHTVLSSWTAWGAIVSGALASWIAVLKDFEPLVVVVAGLFVAGATFWLVNEGLRFSTWLGDKRQAAPVRVEIVNGGPLTASPANVLSDVPNLRLEKLVLIIDGPLASKLEHPIVGVYVKNYGSSTAFITGAGVDNDYGLMASGRNFRDRLALPAGIKVDPAQEPQLVFNSKPRMALHPHQIQRALESGEGIFVYGYINYEDARHNHYTLTFCRNFRRVGMMDGWQWFECTPPPYP